MGLEALRRRLGFAIGLAVALCPASAHAALTTQGLSFTASDGVVLHATVGGDGGLAPRPLIVEDSPYAPDIDPFAGPDYNYVELQWRGTGQSGGALDTTGARDQADLSEFLGWACRQPWSDGRIGLYGFSASAIVVYNSMHLPLPCVKAAALMSGTVDLYRDLLYIGGISNAGPGVAVEAEIAGPWLANVPNRTQQQPASVLPSVGGFVTAPAAIADHPTEDSFWGDRSFRGNRNRIPILADDGFYDVESRGAFLGYRANRRYGSHLLVIGAHDGFAGGTSGPFPHYTRWFDHYVRGIDNGANRAPRVSLYLSQGSHKRLLDGHFTHLSGRDWPLPGTRWQRLYLSPAHSGTAHSLNDGSLTGRRVRRAAVQTYPFAPSNSLATDPRTTSTFSSASGFGLSLDGTATAIPALTDMQTAEPMSLTYTTAPFKRSVDAVGPASLVVSASSSAPVTDLVAILADVAPDGTAEPVATGQLRTAFPRVVRSRSLVDRRTHEIVQPYADFSALDPPPLGARRQYRIEINPIGNRFAAGHRLRLYVVGTSAAQASVEPREGVAPGVNSLAIGGGTRSRLLLPTFRARR